MITAVLHTTEYRGDHSAEVEVALEVGDGEAVGSLLARAAKHCDGYRTDYKPQQTIHEKDWVELRVVVPA